MRESREFDLSQLATKADLKSEIAELRSELKAEIAGLRSELKGEIAGLRGGLRGEIAGLRGGLGEFKADILKWVVGLLIGQAALIVTLVRLFGHP